MIIGQKKTVFGQLANKPVIHIAFGVDVNYVKFAGTTIYSILYHNKNLAIVFHILTDDITADDKKKLSAVAEEFNVQIEVHYIDAVLFTDFQISDRFPKALYYRLLIPNLLVDITDIVLFLDADILCMGSLTDLLSIDLGDRIVGAITDWNDETNLAKKTELNIQHCYFNAGVMYIHIGNWHKFDVTNRVMILLAQNKNRSLPDQDALNEVLDGKVLYLPNKFNTLYSMVHMSHLIANDTVLLHYTDVLKPWHSYCQHPLMMHYRDLALKSPWAAAQAEARANEANARAARAEANASEANARAARAEANASEANARALQAEANANEARRNYDLVVNSHSWRYTKSLRIVGKVVRWFVFGSIAWLRFTPSSRPRRILRSSLIRLKNYINRHPRVKVKIMQALARFPSLKRRLIRIGYSSVFMHVEVMTHRNEALTSRAQDIYEKLRKAINEQRSEKRKWL